MKAMIFNLLLLIAQQGLADGIFTITENNEPIATFHRNTFVSDIPNLEIMDTSKLQDFIDELDRQLNKEPENAYFNERGEVMAEKVGYSLNRHAFLEELFSAYYLGGPSTIEIPKIHKYPKVDSELLIQISTKKIGQYRTFFNGYHTARAHNIALAAKAIDNYVVFPGEIFSFNEVVGQRTVEKGYRKAPEIIQGELTEGIGGGICQVSSTLFNAIDISGLTITERYSHSRNVPYVPPGRDATVSWYGPDFAFKNEYNQPILIRAKVYHGQLAISIYSSDHIEYYPRKIPIM